MKIFTQDSTKERMLQTSNKKIWIIVGGVFVILVIIFAIFLYQLKKEAESLTFVQMNEKTLTETKKIVGEVVSQDKIDIYPSKGIIATVFVKNGQEISEGDELFAYDDTELQSQLKEAEAMEQVASAQYEVSTDQITTIEEQITSYQANMTTPIIDEEGITSTDSQSATESFLFIQTLQTQLIEVQSKQNEAQTDMEKYQSQIESLQQQIENLIVYSSATGVIQNLRNDLGVGLEITEAIRKSPILQIVSTTFLVEGKITQEERAKLKEGQEVEISTNIVPNKKWDGTILTVSDYPVKEKEKSYYSYQAELASQTNIYPGYEVNVHVTTKSKEAIVLPKSSMKVEEGSTYVFVAKEGKLVKKKVEVGMEEKNWIEIKSGLTEQDKVVEKPSWLTEIFFVK